MAHELMEHDSLAFGGQLPWHGIGVELAEDVVDSKTMIETAGLGWEVKKVPAYYENPTDDLFYEVPRQHIIVRTDKNIPLGVVGEAYSPIQNSDRFSFLDALIDNKNCYHVAGSLRNGAYVWVLLKLSDQVEIAKADAVEQYLLCMDSNTGESPFMVFPTNVRVVCKNTLNVALSSHDRSKAIRLRHSGDVSEKLKQASEVLRYSEKSLESAQKIFKSMARAKITRNETYQYLLELLPKGDTERGEARKKTIRNQILQHLDESPNQEKVRGTVWGLWNAVTEWTDHSKKRQTSKIYTNTNEARMADIMLGSTATFKQKSFDIALNYLVA